MLRTALWMSVALLGGCATVPHSSTPPARVAVTGSRLPAPVDARTGQPASSSQVQTVTQDDIQRTGETNLADALRKLLPSVQ